MELENKKDAFSEELDRLYQESIVALKEGEILKGRVVQIGEKEVLIDVGYKSEGVILKSELTEPDELKVGDEIDVMLEAKENDMGMVVLSHEKAKRLKGWQDILDNYKEGDILKGKVSKKVRGGFMVDIGMEAFLPASLSVMQDFGGADNMLARKMDFKVVKINIPRKNIVLSRKEIVEEKRKEEKQEILEHMNKGDVVKGIVRNITDFGAFVDIGGGITGLLHITDMSWGRINHPGEVVKVEDAVDVKILDFDKTNVKVSLGLKQCTPNPWEGIEGKYPEGGVVGGTVVNIMPYGIFVELEEGIEGLIHISEFSWSKKFAHPGEKYKVGDRVEAMILKTDKDHQKLSLGLKQLGKDPWGAVEERYHVGDRVKGTINAVTDYGAFVELENGVEGLVHVSDLSWTKRITHPKELLQKGEEIEAIILNVDEQNRRIALGVKQLVSDPWDEIVTKYEAGTVCDGKITNITNFGIFVEIEKDLEGLLHVSEVELAPSQRMEDVYKIGDVMKVTVIHIDGVQKKIALSNKALDEDASKEAGSEDKTSEESEKKEPVHPDTEQSSGAEGSGGDISEPQAQVENEVSAEQDGQEETNPEQSVE
ncbi:MAG: 30S ribosomal protein S1 [Candidatus Omnitrophota bacterium]